jgi:ATP-binding cassette subfamily B protein
MSTPPPTFWGTWQTRIRALHNIGPLVKIVWESGRVVVCGGLACRIAAALIPLAMLSVSKRILDAVQAHFAGHPLPPQFWYLVAAEPTLAAFGSVLGRLTGYFDALLADRFTRFVSVRVMEHASRLDLASYEDPVFYDQLERARVQSTDRIGVIQAIGGIFQQLIAAISFSAGVFWFSPWLLALLLIAVIPPFHGETHFAFLGYAQNLRQTPMRRQLDYLRMLGASKESAKELELFDLSAFLTGEYTQIGNQPDDQDVRVAKRHLIAGAFLSLLSTAGYYGAYVYVIYRTITGALTWGELQFLAGAIAGASSNIQNVFSSFSSIASQSLFLTDLVEFLRVTPKISSKPNPSSAPRPIRDGFVFEGVSFSYPGSARSVLNRFDLRPDKDEKIALIGENGQGKTTIMKLLTRLYDPCEGRILPDGVDLRDFSIEDLHRGIGVIFQDFVRYEMTVRQNVAVGRMGAPEAATLEAAHKILAEEVIDRLPQRYDQLLGRRFENGVDLSGGEWERMALSRANLRDAQILALDEPNAALDAHSENEIFERFAELTQGKMALLISHRFSPVKIADRILVIADGAIAEQVSHQSLLARGGRYASLFELQASSYR